MLDRMTEWAEFYPLSRGAIFYTSRLRGSYGEARNRVPAGRHTLLAHS